MHIDRNLMARGNIVDQTGDERSRLLLCLRRRRTQIDPQHRAIGHDIVRPAAVDPGRIDLQFVAGCCRRSEEHTSELQSLMRTSYAVFCLKKKNIAAKARACRETHQAYKLTLPHNNHTSPS